MWSPRGARSDGESKTGERETRWWRLAAVRGAPGDGGGRADDCVRANRACCDATLGAPGDAGGRADDCVRANRACATLGAPGDD